MDNNKEQERANLHATIWRIANDLRGSVDGWDFKQYVLGMLFYRFISENLASYIYEYQKTENENFDYAKIEDKNITKGGPVWNQVMDAKGFFIYPSELFENVRKENSDNLNERLEKSLKNIEGSANGTKSEANLKGLFQDIDVNSNKLGVAVSNRNELLKKLMDAIADLDLGNYNDNTIDVFGDAYEYLMSMYAANAGKSGGEFFTPQEVSELLTKIAIFGKTEVNKVYDPACGSGSLLLKFAKILDPDKVRGGFFGQEINLTTYNLCRINMFLHDINYSDFNIAHGDTLKKPEHDNYEPFEAIVSNPPYSIKWEGDSNPVLMNDPRFSPAGALAPKSKADMAFIMHCLSYLATSGTAAIVCFPGIMYRGGAEQIIRKYLIEQNFIDCVIQLPPDLFFGTGIATNILVMKKNKMDTKVLFIDASKEFIRSSAKNKLSSENIEKILNAFGKRENQEHFSTLASFEKIEEQDFNLSVNKYVIPMDNTEIVNIEELNASIAEIVKRQAETRAGLDKIIAELEGRK